MYRERNHSPVYDMSRDTGSSPTRKSTRRRRASTTTTMPIEIPDGNDTMSPPFAATTTRRRRRGRKRRIEEEKDDSPFYVLVVQVGATLLVCSVVVFAVFKWVWSEQQQEEYYYGFGSSGDDQTQQQQELVRTDAPEEETMPPFPIWELGQEANSDAFALSDMYGNNETPFWKVAASIRDEFAERYGGENAARGILERGLSAFGMETTTSDVPSHVKHTACRIRTANEANRPFSFAFGGYSVTAGRGNFFSQSFPFVMQRILQRPFQVVGVELSVLNAAIGGVPSFPYGWCMENFWGVDPDVVSWDYSMNEAGGVPQGLEAYLRHSLTMKRHPKLIVKDTHLAPARRNVLEHYAVNGFAPDSLVVHTDPAASTFLNMPEENRPLGFQRWRNFGGPPGAPGQALHHPAIAEHEFIGWLLAMHFLSALELLVAAREATDLLHCEDRDSVKKHDFLPPPCSVNISNTSIPWSSLFFGRQTQSSFGHEHWRMSRVRCRTSYEPVKNGRLGSIVVSGTIGENLDLSLPKGAMYYTKGWVFDLSSDEVLAKRKLDRFGGLGFVDRKTAYYGIYASGTLSLLLPYEPSEGLVMPTPQIGDVAREWITSITICEVNEKREGRVCNAADDVSYVVGGINATDIKTIDSQGTQYYGKKLCIHIPVPDGARMSSRETNDNGTQVGVALNISVSDMHIMRKEMACSISHVVWEQQERTTEQSRGQSRTMLQQKAKPSK